MTILKKGVFQIGEINMKILIAEDDPMLQTIAGNIMDNWGFDFDIASNGLEAVEKAQIHDGKYDLCLMDIDMPLMDGLEAAKIIRSKAAYFPIMAVTGNLRVRQECLDIGMDDFLLKPYQLNVLFDKVDDLSTKTEEIHVTGNQFRFQKGKPMNQKELQELIQLKKKGLTKLKLVGTEHTFVVHKNIQNKISYDLVGEGKELSEFIDRSENEPGRCHLYKMNLYVTKDLFTFDELESEIEKENEIAVKFNNLTDRKLKKE